MKGFNLQKNERDNHHFKLASGFFISISLVLYAFPSVAKPLDRIKSPDGKYEAILVPIGKKGLHYKIIESKTNRTMLTTLEQRGRTQNDVKAGRFSPDSTQFAAAFHYGHKGKYTWIGVWNIAKGIRRDGIKKNGFVRSIPNSVFTTFTGLWWTVACYCQDNYHSNIIPVKACSTIKTSAGVFCAGLQSKFPGAKCRAIAIERSPDGSSCDPQMWNWQMISSNINSSLAYMYEKNQCNTLKSIPILKRLKAYKALQMSEFNDEKLYSHRTK